jgi:hypothetical protein
MHKDEPPRRNIMAKRKYSGIPGKIAADWAKGYDTISIMEDPSQIVHFCNEASEHLPICGKNAGEGTLNRVILVEIQYSICAKCVEKAGIGKKR